MNYNADWFIPQWLGARPYEVFHGPLASVRGIFENRKRLVHTANLSMHVYNSIVYTGTGDCTIREYQCIIAKFYAR